ncbi:hypothetical protein D9757_012217 [Collybiopsis confluens]|uniref:ZZ-type domain-containing protein n=1 Tax=Collybiopsis confluens TaxID=2823264 RepID=A0A8H5GM16_9AGAR|nr:hypothetical protein D9757_012217 [Collybiopsis confluens]
MVKGQRMVMALREYYAERQRSSQSVEQASIQESTFGVNLVTNSLLHDTTLTYAENDWALEYITITRIQPLLEAFDDDSSSLVSIGEVNTFTEAKPHDWSLPKWMAFWTAGFPLSLKRYYNLIQVLLWHIDQQVPNGLQANKQCTKLFVSDIIITNYIDRLLAGVDDAVDAISDDGDLYERFEGFIVSEEERMQKPLQTLKYRIDAENTLRTVTGPGRLEKYIMPLLYLLFVRVYQISKRALTTVIDPKEICNVLDSFYTLQYAISARAEHLKVLCRLQNLDPRDQLKRICHGIFYYIGFEDDWPKSRYWSKMHLNREVSVVRDIRFKSVLSNSTYADMKTIGEMTSGEPSYSNVSDVVDLKVYEDIDQFVDPFASENTSPSHIWHGFYLSQFYTSTLFDTSPQGVMDFNLPDGDGTISGSGSDAFGDLSLKGRVDGKLICFNVCYISGYASKKTWRYNGELSSEMDSISGRWGPWDSDTVLQDDFYKQLQESDVQGQFQLSNKFPAIRTYVNVDADFTDSLWRTRWQLAIKAIITVLRTRKGFFSKMYLENRRHIRQQILKLLPEFVGSKTPPFDWQIADDLSDEEEEKLSALISYCSRQDVRFYRSLSACLSRRVVVHWGIYCDWENENGGRKSRRITDTRFFCLDCLKIDSSFGMLDLCDKHMDLEVDRTADDTHHISSHDLLQLRFCCPRRAEIPLAKASLDIAKQLHIEDFEGHAHRICLVCESTLGRPYWYCLACPDGKFICMTCKYKLDHLHSPVLDMDFIHSSQAEEKKPEHLYQHTLILCRASYTPTPKVIDTEERLADVSGRLEAMGTRIDSLESTIQSLKSLNAGIMERLESVLSGLADMVVPVNTPRYIHQGKVDETDALGEEESEVDTKAESASARASVEHAQIHESSESDL